MLYSGTYGYNNSQYRKYDSQTSRIIATGNQGNGPLYFVEYTKDGYTIEFGNSSDSRVNPLGSNNSIAEWKVNKIIDRSGNFITYHYENTDGECTIKYIRYTGNSTLLEPYNEIEFVYEHRTADPVKKYIADEEFTKKRILKTINVYSEQVLVKHYEFSYSGTLFSHLVEINEYNSLGERVNPTLIQWDSHGPFTSNETITFNPTYGEALSAMGDYNLDGKTDFVTWKSSPGGGSIWSLYINNGLGSYTRTDYCNSDDPSRFKTYAVGFSPYTYNFSDNSDFNHDGRSDVIMRAGDTLLCYMASPNNRLIFNQLDTCIVNGLSKYFTGDFTGNGCSEVLVQGSNKTVIHSFDSDQSWTITLPSNYYIIEDINGDGKTDLINLTGTGYSVYEFNYNQNTNTFSLNQISQETNQYLTSSILQRHFVGDFNNDGYVDFLVKPYSSDWYILKGTGSKFIKDINLAIPLTSQFDPFAYQSDKGVYVRDINSDGYSDIIATSTLYKNNLPDSVGINFHLSNGATFQSEAYSFYYPSKTSQGSFVFGDFKGDNSIDGLLNMSKVVQTGGYFKNHLIKFIADGYNNLTKFAFAKGVRPDNNQTKQYIYWPFIYAPTNITVIDSLKVYNRNTTFVNEKYSFANPVIHVSGLGMLGYANFNTLDVISRMMEKKFKSINHSFAYQYTSKKQLFDGQNIEVQWSTSLPTLAALSHGGYTLSQTYTEEKDITTSILNKQTTVYDDYLNVISELKDFNAQGFENIYYFYDDLGSWCPAVIDSIIVSKRKIGSIESFTTTTGLTYNSTGLVQQTRLYSNTALPLVTDYVYDNFGLVTEVKTTVSVSDKRKVNYVYDTKKRLPITTSYGSMSESRTYDFRYGNTLTHTNAGGITSYYQYDGSGIFQRLSVTDNIYSSQSVYWDIDTLINSTYRVESTVNGGPKEIVYYHSYGRDVRNAAVVFGGQLALTDKQYNNRGYLKHITNPYLYGGTPVWSTFSYDTIGRLSSTIINNTTTSITYSNSTTTYSSYRGGFNRSQAININGLGQISEVSQDGLVLDFEYDNGGRASLISPPEAWTEVSLSYDSRGIPSQVIEPNSGTTTVEKNGLFEDIMRVTNSGDSTVFSYDILGRDSIWQTPDGNTNFSYETNGPGRGKIKGASTPQAYYDYKYNSLGLLSRSCDSISQNEAMPFLYEYDSCGRVSKLTYPTGYFVTYEYDTRGYLWKIKDGLTNLVLWQCSSMNADGNITESTMGSGMITVSKSFDNYGFLTQIKAEKNNGVLQWFGYSFDVSTGNLQWRSDSLRNLRELFGYDIHDRLIWSKGTGIDSLVLSYDDIGNILSKTDVGGYFYDEDKVHAVDSISPLAPSYGGVDQRISYNYLNLPKYIATDNDSLVFTYGMGTKRIKTVLYDSDNQVKRTIWYSDSYERIQEGGSDRSYHWIQSPEGPVALVLTGVNTPRQIYFLCKDHLGSITALIDTTGNIVEELSFDPWGRRRSPGTWSYIYPSSLISHRGYTTHEHLDEFGLIHMNGRLYDPQLGRFLNPDPIIQDPNNIQSYNSYSYCLNNPLKYIDPSGYNWNPIKKLIKYIKQVFDDSPKEYDGPIIDFVENGGAGAPSGYNTSGTCTVTPGPKISALNVLGVGVDVALVIFDVATIPSGEAIAGIAARKALWTSMKSAKVATNAAKGSTATARALGVAGERAVGFSGKKTAIQVGSRTRIPDALTRTTLTEVKNVKSLSFTRQLRDFHTYSQQNGLDFILYTRPNTTLSGPLQQAINNGSIIHSYIPGL